MRNGLRRLAVWALMTMGAMSAAAQVVTVSGHVVDVESGENVIGAAIYAPHLRVGTTTNQYGFYSLTLEADTVTLVVSHIVYESELLRRELTGDLRLDIELSPAVLTLDGVEVVASAAETQVEDIQMSRVDLPIAKIQSLPALLGEVDVLKTIQLLPGVQSGREGTSGLYVRGGGPDQNLLLLDGAPVYNASHLFGFMSVFNGDAIKNVSLVKGGFPARYGGRLSSVVDMTMKEGNLKEYRGKAAVGIIASRFTFEGPIVRDRSSFLISARRTYIDLLVYPFLPNDQKGGYHFYDVNAKANYILSNRDRVYVSVYAGRDKAYLRSDSDYGGTSRDRSESDMNWGNVTATARWNHMFSPRLFANTLVGHTRYNLKISNESEWSNSRSGTASEVYASSYTSGIRDWQARTDFEFARTPAHQIRFGAAAVAHTFNTGAVAERISGADVVAIDTVYTPDHLTRGAELSAYMEHELRFSPRFKMNAGVHASGFLVTGKRYASVQPRVSLWVGVRDNLSLKASYAAMQQYIHLLSSVSGFSLPTDLWVPVTDRIRPQRAHQVTLGMVQALREGRYEVSVEGFYKKMDDLIEYREGANYIDASAGDWQTKVAHGEGWSYGAEVFVQKKSGRTTGWIGYTLSWADRRFERINFGRRFPYRYDRRHDASVVVTHRWKQSVEVSASWVYGTGQAVSIPIGQFRGVRHVPAYRSDVDGYVRPRRVNFYGSRNSFRMEAFHRLDLAVHLHKTGRWAERTLSVGFYNAYNRKNPFLLYYEWEYEEEDRSDRLVFKKFSLLPVLPFITYQLEF